jgi:hypothetical protein
MDNCKSVISKHNFGTLLKNKSVVVASTKDNCNCIESTECPLNNNCLTKSVVYKAEVTDDTGVIRDYIGRLDLDWIYQARLRNVFTTTRPHSKILRAMLNPLSCPNTFGTWKTRNVAYIQHQAVHSEASIILSQRRKKLQPMPPRETQIY